MRLIPEYTCVVGFYLIEYLVGHIHRPVAIVARYNRRFIVDDRVPEFFEFPANGIHVGNRGRIYSDRLRFT